MRRVKDIAGRYTGKKRHKEEKSCLACGTTFITKDPERKYCSLLCMGKSYTTQVTKKCIKCNTAFLVKKYRKNKAKYCSRECRTKETIKHGEYLFKRCEGIKNYRNESRVIVEKHMRRRLRSDEIVHHRNHNKKDNRIENLVIMTRAQHALHHHGQYFGANKKH